MSDHSLGSKIASYSLIAGATVFEKHMGLQAQKKGLDLEFSSIGKNLDFMLKKLKKHLH